MLTLSKDCNYERSIKLNYIRSKLFSDMKLLLVLLSASLLVLVIHNNSYTKSNNTPEETEYNKVSDVLNIEIGGGILLKTVQPVFPTAGVTSQIDNSKVLVDGIESYNVNTLNTTSKEEKKMSVEDFAFANKGYIRPTILNIRRAPSVESEIIGTYLFNQEVRYSDYDDNWAIVNSNGNLGFIHKSFINSNKSSYVSKEVVIDERKSYMDYKKITHKNSPQYVLQSKAKTKSGMRTVNSRYCIALGSYYTTNVGQYVDVVLDNGEVLECIVGDCKADKDTVNGKQGRDGGTVEFIVSTSDLSPEVRSSGDCSMKASSWNSKVKEIRIYNVDLV